MTRLDDFLANLGRTALVAPRELKRVVAQLPPKPEQDAAVRLARLLIQQRLLTTYQARKVLAGATRGFFLANFRILRPIGEGGMGKVYLAESEQDGQRVAIKVLPPRRAAEEQQALLRFRREMELSQRLVHPNVARTLEVGRQGDVHFMVLEYIRGRSLYEMVHEGGPLRVPDAARYFLKVLEGLEAAHQAGIVHRDLKPSNLMVTPEGDAKILDLGLAKAIGEESPLTRPNVVIGTLDYASPEQLGNAAKADKRSDLYSLGCTIYFTLSGRAPFEGGDVVNKIFKQRMEDPEPLELVARGVPAAFAAIVRTLMAKKPEDRYATVADLRTDLARWADPALVKAILGAEAEVARAFRPPPPELEEEDLRLIENDASPSAGPITLRDLGDAAPGVAPMHKFPPPPRPAVYSNDPPAGFDENRERQVPDEGRWLVHFIAIALVLGLIAVVLITVCL